MNLKRPTCVDASEEVDCMHDEVIASLVQNVIDVGETLVLYAMHMLGRDADVFSHFQGFLKLGILVIFFEEISYFESEGAMY